MDTIIRKIEPKDDPQVANVIRTVLIEHNVPKVGTAYADVSLDHMFDAYNSGSSVYYVAEREGSIIGGAGIAPLENGPEDTCELQKMYFLAEARGLGLGAKMMELCLESARAFGFKKCYLETMPYMEAAQKLYKRFGFQYLDAPMGCTGHSSCPVWMILNLGTSKKAQAKS